jgi:molybdopterin-guanine dinucleotide biosynthesis protein A
MADMSERIGPVEAASERRAQPVLAPHRSDEEPVTGILLVGGRSRRMGADKAWQRLAGKPMVEWALDALRAVTEPQILVAREAAPYERLGVRIVTDQYPQRGPLAGIHAGLKAIPTDLALVLAVDMPLARPELLAFLVTSVGPAHAAVPYVDIGSPPAPGTFTTAREAGLQPLCAAYRRTCLSALEKVLAAGPVPTGALLALIKARIVSPDEWRPYDEDSRSFFNVNTLEDLFQAERILSRSE